MHFAYTVACTVNSALRSHHTGHLAFDLCHSIEPPFNYLYLMFPFPSFRVVGGGQVVQICEEKERDLPLGCSFLTELWDSLQPCRPSPLPKFFAHLQTQIYTSRGLGQRPVKQGCPLSLIRMRCDGKPR